MKIGDKVVCVIGGLLLGIGLSGIIRDIHVAHQPALSGYYNLEELWTNSFNGVKGFKIIAHLTPYEP